MDAPGNPSQAALADRFTAGRRTCLSLKVRSDECQGIEARNRRMQGMTSDGWRETALRSRNTDGFVMEAETPSEFLFQPFQVGQHPFMSPLGLAASRWCVHAIGELEELLLEMVQTV